MARKIFSVFLFATGMLGAALGLLLGYAIIAGGYLPKPFVGAMGHIAGMFAAVLGGDLSITAIFWAGVVLVVCGWFVWPRR